MKKIFVLLFLLIATFGAAQNGISYQAVLLNPNGEQLPGADNSKIPLVNSSICLRFSIAASSGGTPEYQETITTKTDPFGMVNVTIGTGNPTPGSPSFNTISWGSGPKNLKVELDLTGLCTSFITVSDQPFTSVPFALYALNSGSGGGASTTTLTGDVSGTGTGTFATTISNDAVTTTKIANSSVTNAKLQNSSITINGNTVALGGTATINTSPIGTALTSGNVLVGNASNVAAEVTMNGDVSINNLGVTTIAPNAVTSSKIADSNVTNAKLQNSSITINGNTVALGGTATINASPVGTTLTSGNVLVGSASNLAAEVTMNGDVTITNAGVTVIGTGKVTDAKLDKTNIPLSGFGAASANVALGGNKLSGVADPTLAQDAATKSYVDSATTAITNLTNGNVFIGNSSNVATQVAVTGDVTITNAGVTAIGTGKVDNTKLDKINIPLSGFGAALAAVDLGSNKLTNVTDPTLAQDASTKNYVDAKIVDVITNTVTSSAPSQNAVFDALALKEDTANKSSDITLSDISGAKFPTELAVKTFVETKVVDNINNGVTSSAPTQNAVFDALALKEDAANKSSDVNLSDALGIKFPTELAVKTFVETKVVDNINNGVTSSAPTQNAVFDALALKEDAANKSSDVNLSDALGIKFPTELAVKTFVETKVVDNINNGVTSSAPTQNAVFDALALKEDAANKSSDVNLSDALGIKFPTELAVKTFVETKVVDNINNGVTSSAPTQNAVFDALALKEDAANKSSDVNLSDALGIKFPTELAVKTFVETKVVDNINNGVTSSAPTQNAVFDALALKEDAANKSSDVNLSDALGIKFPTELAVKTFVETKVVDNINNGVTSSAPTQNAVFDALALKEDAANKSSDVNLSDALGIKFPTELAVKTYVDNQIAIEAPNATTILNGKIRLAGDLAGIGTTATAPVISDNAITSAKISNGTITNADISNTAAIQTSKIKGFYSGITNIDVLNNAGDVNIPIGSGGLNITEGVTKNATIIFQNNGSQDIYVKFAKLTGAVNPDGITYNFIKVGFNYDSGNYSGKLEFSYIIILNN
jgi:hypothetical protein